MADETVPSDNTSSTPVQRGDGVSKWGARLFMGTLFVVLVFFWWLIIYSGGVTAHHP